DIRVDDRTQPKSSFLLIGEFCVDLRKTTHSFHILCVRAFVIMSVIAIGAQRGEIIVFLSIEFSRLPKRRHFFLLGGDIVRQLLELPRRVETATGIEISDR